MIATMIIFVLLGLVLIYAGHRIDNGPGSADEKIASVIPYFGSAVCFVVAIILLIVWAILK